MASGVFDQISLPLVKLPVSHQVWIVLGHCPRVALSRGCHPLNRQHRASTQSLHKSLLSNLHHTDFTCKLFAVGSSTTDSECYFCLECIQDTANCKYRIVQ